MRLRCRFGWHDWSNWKIVYTEDYEIFGYDKTLRALATCTIQERYCKSCNKHERHVKMKRSY